MFDSSTRPPNFQRHSPVFVHREAHRTSPCCHGLTLAVELENPRRAKKTRDSTHPGKLPPPDTRVPGNQLSFQVSHARKPIQPSFSRWQIMNRGLSYTRLAVTPPVSSHSYPHPSQATRCHTHNAVCLLALSQLRTSGLAFPAGPPSDPDSLPLSVVDRSTTSLALIV